MSDVAALIADMVRAGVDPDIIGRTAAALSKNVQVVQSVQDPVAERRRAYDRDRKAAKKLSTGIPPESTESADLVSPKKETSPTPPKEKTTPSSSGDKSPSRCESETDFFPDFWLAYPRREGSNPKKPARERFIRLIAKGVRPEALIAAAQALAVEHPTPTRFVPQAVTWLNQERFEDAEPVIAGDTFCAEDIPSTRLHVIRFRNGNDGADPPRAVQGGKAGYLIPTEWVKSMQMRQAHG